MPKKKKLIALTLASGLALGMAFEYNIYEKYPSVNLSNTSIEEAVADYEKKHGVNLESTKIKVLNKYFTKEAFDQLKDIPVVYGKSFTDSIALATGGNLSINFLSFVGGYGWDRKTIVTKKEIGDSTCVHEYIHHASSLGIINYKDFESAWSKFSSEEEYREIIFRIDEKIKRNYNKLLMKLFSQNINLERQAILIDVLYFPEESKNKKIVKKELPYYMKKVYERTLNFEILELK